MSSMTGIVLDRQSEGRARIVTHRSGACGDCDSGSGHCHSCLTHSDMVSVVANPVGAEPGDTVRVEIDSVDVFKGALVLYFAPVVMLLAGVLLGSALGPRWGVSDTAGAIAGGLMGLICGMVPVKMLDRSQWAKNKLAPTITAVLSSSTKS